MDESEEKLQDQEIDEIEKDTKKLTKEEQEIDRLEKEVKKFSKKKKEDEDATIVDVHIKNPLKKIIELLEEIKQQKAFTFTLRGSLGIAGVALVLSMTGLLGTSYALCDKGMQTHIGTLKALNANEVEEDSILNRIKNINDYFTALLTGKKMEDRTDKRSVLVKMNFDTIQIIRGRDVSLLPYRNREVIVTGPYNSCSLMLKVQNQSEIEKL
jgi:hypothetical protein